MKLYATDIRDKKEFAFGDDTLKQKCCLDEEKHIYLYERSNHLGYIYGYELVQGVKRKNPDGKEVFIYPSTEQFGKYGYFFSSRYAEKDIPKYLKKLQEKKAPGKAR